MGGVRMGQLYRKRTVRKMDGSIVDMIDESDGGVIISKGNVVNQEKINKLAQMEEDRRKAATAFTEQVAPPAAIAEQRATPPTKIIELEKRIDDMGGKLDAILAALKK